MERTQKWFCVLIRCFEVDSNKENCLRLVCEKDKQCDSEMLSIETYKNRLLNIMNPGKFRHIFNCNILEKWFAMIDHFKRHLNEDRCTRSVFNRSVLR